MNPNVEVVTRPVEAALPRAFRIKISGITLVGSPAKSLNELKLIVLELANRSGMNLFECAVGRSFLPVYGASGNPTAAVEAIVYDPALELRESVTGLRRIEELFEELPVCEARYVDGGWAFVVERAGEVVRCI